MKIGSEFRTRRHVVVSVRDRDARNTRELPSPNRIAIASDARLKLVERRVTVSRGARIVEGMPPPPAPTLDKAVDALLGALAIYLPPPAGALPDPTVSMASLTERGVGLGNIRGTDLRGLVAVGDLKGIRADGVARFVVWASGPAQADAEVSALVTRIAADSEKLRRGGFLRLALDAAPPAEPVAALTGWRKHADYRVLYEFGYVDNDSTGGLIARIPIDFGIAGEATSVSDSLVCWDDVDALPLVVRGPLALTTLTLLSFVAAATPTGAIRLTRTFDGAVGPPTTFATIGTFLAAVGGTTPEQRHATTTFASYAAFVAACTLAGDPVVLADTYESRALALGTIALTSVTDRFELTYSGAKFDTVAVAYLRAIRG